MPGEHQLRPERQWLGEKRPSPFPLAAPPGLWAPRRSRPEGGEAREQTGERNLLKGYIVSLPTLPRAAATPPGPWAPTSVPTAPALQLHSTAHSFAPPLGGAAPPG